MLADIWVKAPSLVGTRQAGPGKEVELPPDEELWGKDYCSGKIATWKGHRPPSVIPDMTDISSTGNKINFKPPWMVALGFCSIFCLLYGAGLCFVPEMGAQF